MAASNEWEERHLIHAGWEPGSAKYDFGPPESRPVPIGTVLTCRRHVYVGAIGASPSVDQSCTPLIKDDNLIKELLEKFGQPQFGV